MRFKGLSVYYTGKKLVPFEDVIIHIRIFYEVNLIVIMKLAPSLNL